MPPQPLVDIHGDIVSVVPERVVLMPQVPSNGALPSFMSPVIDPGITNKESFKTRPLGTETVNAPLVLESGMVTTVIER